MIAGFVGLIFLMENWSDGPKRLNTVTLVFGIPAGICVALIPDHPWGLQRPRFKRSTGLSILLFGFLILCGLRGLGIGCDDQKSGGCACEWPGSVSVLDFKAVHDVGLVKTLWLYICVFTL
jgi:hypothetical protein